MAMTSEHRPSPLERRFQGEHPLRTLKYLMLPERWKLIWGTVFYVIKHSPMWLMPLLTANVIDIIAQPEKHSRTELWWNAVVLVVILVQNPITHYIYVCFVSRASRNVETQLRSSICRRLQQLSIGFYSRQSAGKLQSKVLRDVEAIEQLLRAFFDAGLMAVVNIVFALIVTAMRVPWFIVFYVLTVPVAAGLIVLLRRRLDARNTTFRKEVEQMSARVIEMTHLIPITRAHGLESSALDRIGQSLQRVRQAGLEVDEINAVFGSISWMTFNLFNMACLIIAAWAYAAGWLPITIGDVVMLTTYFSMMTGSVMVLAGTLPQISKGLEAVRSIGEVLESPDLEQNEGKATVSAVRGEFRFEKVSFQYTGTESHAVQDFDLTVAQGETIALVGPSGAGKSTLLNLVIGYVRPTAGRIVLDGRDMSEADLRTYRRFLAVVPQESILFDGTIRENVTYGLASVSDAVVEQALRDANAWEFVQRLPDGTKTLVGERGARLSGGQKQRLAIARALIRNPSVLVLDEATSALDTETEALIQEALERLMRGRTTFVVAHRLSTIRNANRIVVMQHGRIAEIGSHDALLAKNGLYAQLHARQAGEKPAAE
ncbi:MAG TPA: ABC transporter ATP-binding protein [Opitutaceae bacterium]|nr:ABC transporter ATP-binding protein [Opitutaceae bacterium]HOR25211.1 ABC transporter ATP-binding protein [Opitutaceae bacterium]